MNLRLLALTGIVMACPAVSLAQVDAQQRMEQMQQRAVAAEQQRRTEEVERRVDTLDLRLRTQQTQRELEAQSYPPPTPTQAWIAPAAPALPEDLAQAAERRRAALDASNARLRELSEGQGR